ncbi:hypothetical protein Fmac_018500 [Flemingia macrophylla]|uniref:Guanine nucleotide-binding protein-like 3 N-terminal domain-containing protein n=1 Tax=Flemingia macrophylla TaxID=520843 RepID=A0ABD1M565_9FABA
MVIRKVKEHNRKKTKEAKKLRLSRKKKVEKDPGIPNDWPLKEHEVKALEAGRAKAIAELERKKVESKERVWKRKLGLLEDEDNFNGANWNLSKIGVNLFVVGWKFGYVKSLKSLMSYWRSLKDGDEGMA